MPTQAIFQIIVYGIIIGVFYGLVGIGLALLFGIMRYLNIAHGSFMMIGGLIAFVLFSQWQIDPFLSVPLILVFMFFMGVFLYRVIFSRLSKLSEGHRIHSSMLLTFGLHLVLDNTGIILWTSDVKTITTSYSGAVFELFGLRVPFVNLVVVGLTVVIILALHLVLKRTYLGKSIRATAQNWEISSLAGVNIDRAYLISCGISVALAGIAGIAVGVMYSVSPSAGLEWLLISFVVITLAGLGNVKGVFLAGIILGTIEQLSVFFIGEHYRAVVGLMVFLLILILKPEGLVR